MQGKEAVSGCMQEPRLAGCSEAERTAEGSHEEYSRVPSIREQLYRYSIKSSASLASPHSGGLWVTLTCTPSSGLWKSMT